jgi:hypothetical protein
MTGKFGNKEEKMAQVKAFAIVITAVCGAVLAAEKVAQMVERRMRK